MDDRVDPATARGYDTAPVTREEPPPAGERPAERALVRRRRRVWPAVVAVALIAGAVLWAHPWAGRAKKPFQAAPPQPVAAAVATTGTMPVVMRALGTVTPWTAVTIVPRINGQLMSVGFKPGQMVTKGQFLAQIDPRPYQVALAQAKGQLAHDTGLLDQAKSDLARYRQLAAQNSIAPQQVSDQAFLVQQDEGNVQSDQAAVASDQLNLAYCHIVSPITGRVGLLQIDPGNYVQSTTATGIVTIDQLDPISVVFTLPQDDIAAVSAAMAQGPLPVTLDNGSGTKTIAAGTLTAMDNQINVSTGTVQLQANFANPRGALFPNQFVNVNLLVRTLRNAVLVPNTAIQHGAPGTFVYVVLPNHTAAVRKVTLGPGNAHDTVVTAGLAAGTQVVAHGAGRLHPGAKIEIVATARAASASAPTASAASPAASAAPAASSAASAHASPHASPAAR